MANILMANHNDVAKSEDFKDACLPSHWDDAKLTVDLWQLFMHQSSGHMSEWMYAYGSLHLERFFVSEQYQGNRESKYISDIAESFEAGLPAGDYNVIEIGVGGEAAVRDKTIPFFESFTKSSSDKRILTYHPMDIVEDYPVNASNMIEQNFLGISSTPHVGNYRKSREPLIGNPAHNSRDLVISWNSPIWNSSIFLRDGEEEHQMILAGQLSKMRKIANPDSDLIITHYSGTDTNIEDFITAYKHEASQAAVMSILDLADDILDIKVKLAEKALFSAKRCKPVSNNLRDHFAFSARYDKNLQTVLVGWKSKEDIIINFGMNDIAIAKDTEFVVTPSAKPDQAAVQALARAAGGTIRNTETLARKEAGILAQDIHFPG